MPIVKNSNIEKYKTISKASETIGLPAYVLRFWEKEFAEIQPYKSKGRRYYLDKDIRIIQEIKRLLHSEGFTIEGAKKYLKSKKRSASECLSVPTEAAIQEMDVSQKEQLKSVIHKLKKIQSSLIVN